MGDAIARAVQLLVDGRTPDWSQLRSTVTLATDLELIDNLEAIASASRIGLRPPASSDTIGIAAPEANPGERWGPLEILAVVGHGAHGTVFRAWDTRLAREVALKLLHQSGVPSPVETLREARLLAKIEHPGVVTVYGADRCDGAVGWWMPLIDGATLEETLALQGPFSPREAALIGRELCSALGAVHAAGLVHGDVKLQNIMRERGGRIVLMDFGAGHARDTVGDAEDRALTGTPLYMAPELLAGDAPTVRSDLYALGTVLYRLVTGEYPAQAESIRELQAVHRSGALIPMAERRPGVPPAFASAVSRALSPVPGARFDSAAAFGRALGEIDAPSARPARRVMVVALVALALLVGTVAGALWWLRWSPGRQGAPGTTATELNVSTVTLWNGFENIAREQFARREFGAAAGSYLEAIGVLRTELPEENSAVGLTYAKAGWMWHLAGRYADARTDLQLALHNLLASAGADHPLRATCMAALTANWQAEGNLDEAMRSWREGLAIRQHFLGISEVDAARVFDDTGVTDARWADALSRASVAADDDGDGLADAVELALGLDPHRMQSGSGVLDGEGDNDGDGWSDHLEFGLDWDPTSVISHDGATDPLELGFRRTRTFESGAVTMPGTGRAAWHIKSDSLGHYAFELPRMLKIAALSGFTLTIRSRLIQGGSYVSLDLYPFGPRFDTDTYFTPAGTPFIKSNTGIVPHAGPEYPVEGSSAPLTQLRYRPETGGTLWIDGRKRGEGYRGFTAYQEGNGLFFGAYDRFNAAPFGAAEYALVHLAIRPPEPDKASQK